MEGAIALLASLNPNVVLLDMNITDDEGVEIAKHIAGGFPGVRVIVYSALGGRESEVISLGLRFLFKGYELAELLATIREEASA